MTLLIKYEKCGFSLYANQKLITDYSRLGLEKAKEQAATVSEVLQLLNVQTKIEIDLEQQPKGAKKWL